MLKRMLLLLADTSSSICSATYAFGLAKRSGAKIAGLAGVNLSAVAVRMPGSLGTAIFRAKLETN